MDEPDDWEPSDCVYERYALWVSVTTLVTVLLDAVSIGAECDLSSGAWDLNKNLNFVDSKEKHVHSGFNVHFPG